MALGAVLFTTYLAKDISQNHSNSFINNSALYGDIHASVPKALVWDPPAEEQVRPFVHSGEELAFRQSSPVSHGVSTLRLHLQDSYGQKVRWVAESYDFAVALYASSDFALEGPWRAGIQPEGDIIFTGTHTLPPALFFGFVSDYSVPFALYLGVRVVGPVGVAKIWIIPGPALASQNLFVFSSIVSFEVRPCGDGEVPEVAFPDSPLLVCKQCPFATYSFANYSKCLPCLSGATCTNGMIVVSFFYLFFIASCQFRSFVG